MNTTVERGNPIESEHRSKNTLIMTTDKNVRCALKNRTLGEVEYTGILNDKNNGI